MSPDVAASVQKVLFAARDATVAVAGFSMLLSLRVVQEKALESRAMEETLKKER